MHCVILLNSLSNFIFRYKGTIFFRYTQTKSQKNDEYFQNNHTFGKKGVEGRLSRTAACSQLGDMKITIYDAEDFFRSLFRSLFRNLFRSRYSAIIYRKFYRKSLYLSEIYRKFIGSLY